MTTIRIDDDVEAAIAAAGSFGESYNDVLRRTFGLPVGQRQRGDGPARAGRLKDLIDAGLLTDGQALTWRRPNRGETHTAVVTSDGRIRTADGEEHTTPSRASIHLTGYPVKGWAVWATADGVTLDRLRARLPA